MNPFYTFEFWLLLACASFYYKAAEMENSSGVLWAGLSVLVFVVTWIVLSWGLLGCLAGQIALFVLIAIVRTLQGQSR